MTSTAVEIKLFETGGVHAAQVSFVVHATTVATNAIIEGTIARSGFVTTDGFRDLLEIARQVRPTLYDTQFEKAAPLVPRDRAVVVRERLGQGLAIGLLAGFRGVEVKTRYQLDSSSNPADNPRRKGPS